MHDPRVTKASKLKWFDQLQSDTWEYNYFNPTFFMPPNYTMFWGFRTEVFYWWFWFTSIRARKQHVKQKTDGEGEKLEQNTGVASYPWISLSSTFIIALCITTPVSSEYCEGRLLDWQNDCSGIAVIFENSPTSPKCRFFFRSMKVKARGWHENRSGRQKMFTNKRTVEVVSIFSTHHSTRFYTSGQCELFCECFEVKSVGLKRDNLCWRLPKNSNEAIMTMFFSFDGFLVPIDSSDPCIFLKFNPKSIGNKKWTKTKSQKRWVWNKVLHINVKVQKNGRNFFCTFLQIYIYM